MILLPPLRLGCIFFCLSDSTTHQAFGFFYFKTRGEASKVRRPLRQKKMQPKRSCVREK